MKRVGLWFVLGVVAVLLVSAWLGYRLAPSEPEGPGAPQATGEVPPSGEPEAFALPAPRPPRAQELPPPPVAPPTADEPNAPPFKEQLVRNLAATTKYVEQQIAEFSTWKYYERCRAEHAADGFQADAAHRACVVHYNRAMSEYLDVHLDHALALELFPAYHRARFYKEAVYAEVNRILLESDNVVERLVALKLIERTLIQEGAPLAMDVYHHLDRFSSPELSLIFDPRYELPRTDPVVVAKLVEQAVKVDESIETSNRAGMLLGSPENADKIVEVVNTVMDAGFSRDMRSLPRGLASALGPCGKPCMAGFERLAEGSTDPFTAMLLYTALFGIKDPTERREVARAVEGRMAPLNSLAPPEREHRENVFAKIME